MKIPLIRIGNSKGIRIPQSLIKQCDLSDDVNIEVKNKSIIITSIRKPRNQWQEVTHNAVLKNNISMSEEWKW